MMSPDTLDQFLVRSMRTLRMRRILSSVCIAVTCVAILFVPIVVTRHFLHLSDMLLWFLFALTTVVLGGILGSRCSVRREDIVQAAQLTPTNRYRLGMAVEFMSDPNAFKQLAVLQFEQWLREQVPPIKLRRYKPRELAAAFPTISLLLLAWWLTQSWLRPPIQGQQKVQVPQRQESLARSEPGAAPPTSQQFSDDHVPTQAQNEAQQEPSSSSAQNRSDSNAIGSASSGNGAAKPGTSGTSGGQASAGQSGAQPGSSASSGSGASQGSGLSSSQGAQSAAAPGSGTGSASSGNGAAKPGTSGASGGQASAGQSGGQTGSSASANISAPQGSGLSASDVGPFPVPRGDAAALSANATNSGVGGLLAGSSDGSVPLNANKPRENTRSIQAVTAKTNADGVKSTDKMAVAEADDLSHVPQAVGAPTTMPTAFVVPEAADLELLPPGRRELVIKYFQKLRTAPTTQFLPPGTTP